MYIHVYIHVNVYVTVYIGAATLFQLHATEVVFSKRSITEVHWEPNHGNTLVSITLKNVHICIITCNMFFVCATQNPMDGTVHPSHNYIYFVMSINLT